MPSVAEEWFRSPAWDEAARVDFEARLRRARPGNRQQYVRIKGLALLDAGHTRFARELLERAADHPDGHLSQTISAWEALAGMARQRGDHDTATDIYRRILALPNQSGSSSTVEISLAETLLDTGRPADRDEASAVLEAWTARTGLKFDDALFRWHLARIRLAEAVGDRETIRRAASTALELAGRGPRLPRHPDVGLVHTDKDTLKWLRRLAK